MFKRIRGLLAATLAMAALALVSTPASATGIGLALNDPLNAAEKTFVEHTVAIGASDWTALGGSFDNNSTNDVGCCALVRATWLADKWSGVTVFESIYAASGLSGTYPTGPSRYLDASNGFIALTGNPARVYSGEALADPSYHHGAVGIYAAPGSNLSNFLNAVAASVPVSATQSAFSDLHNGDAAVYVVLDDISLVPVWKGQMATDQAGKEPFLPVVAPPVPENSTYAMFAAGLLGLGFTARRRKQAFGRQSFDQT